MPRLTDSLKSAQDAIEEYSQSIFFGRAFYGKIQGQGKPRAVREGFAKLAGSYSSTQIGYFRHRRFIKRWRHFAQAWESIKQ